MRAGYNPTRRNRNIGTEKAGRGRDNRFVIPICSPMAVAHYECIRRSRSVTRQIGRYVITFVVEATRRGSPHACTVDDVVHVLEHVPAADLEGIELVVMRQPTRKENILDPVWGRLAFFAKVGRHSGRAIFLESVATNRVIRWSKSLNPELAEELDRLRTDGHSIAATKRNHVVSSGIGAARATQLYRTLLHEIGHHVDYERDPDGFDLRPSVDKERFAHSYANDLRESLMAAGVLPFEPIIDPASLARDGLSLSDFRAC